MTNETYYGSIDGLIGPSERGSNCIEECEDLALPTHAWPGDERICDSCYQEEIGMMAYEYAIGGVVTHWMIPVKSGVLGTIASDVREAAKWL